MYFHSLVLDGVYLEGADGRLRFFPVPPPSDAKVARITRTLARRLHRQLLEVHRCVVYSPIHQHRPDEKLRLPDAKRPGETAGAL